MRNYIDDCSFCKKAHPSYLEYKKCVMKQRGKIEIIVTKPTPVSYSKEYHRLANQKYDNKKENRLKHRERDFQRYYRLKALGIRVGGKYKSRVKKE